MLLQLRLPPLVQAPPQRAQALLLPLLPMTRTRQRHRKPHRPRLQPSPLKLRPRRQHRPLLLRLHRRSKQLRLLSPHRMAVRSS